MAIVLLRMAAGTRPRARLVAFWRTSTARHGRVDHLRSAMAMQLIERYAVTTIAVASVAKSFTTMETAAQCTSAYDGADMVDVYAACKNALVPKKFETLIKPLNTA